MRLRSFPGLKAILCIFVFVVFSNAVFPQSRPNILIIVSDDHAYQAIGAYGSKYGGTPNIDRLAAQGETFTNAIVTNSLCGPSRACILTGKYSNINGFKDNFSRFNPAQPTFASYLTEAGYQTAWIGKWHLENNPRNFTYFKVLVGQGYYYNPDFITMDSSIETFPGYCTDIITDLTLDWLQHKRDPSAPFCLVVGEKATHRTWVPDTADYGKFDNVRFALPHDFFDDYKGRYAGQVQDMNIAHSMRLGYDLKMDADTGFGKENYTRMTPSQRKYFDDYYLPIYAKFKSAHLKGNALTEWKYQRYMNDYMSTALSLDRNIGRIVDYIDKSGLGKNTIVIYTSDQGFYLGEHGWFDKRFMYEESLKTPLIIRYPIRIKPGARSAGLVMHLDLAPTFMELAGLKVPGDMQGKSLLPVFAGNKRAFATNCFITIMNTPMSTTLCRISASVQKGIS
jgi:arylsulfatase A-like enzyme